MPITVHHSYHCSTFLSLFTIPITVHNSYHCSQLPSLFTISIAVQQFRSLFTIPATVHNSCNCSTIPVTVQHSTFLSLFNIPTTVHSPYPCTPFCPQFHLALTTTSPFTLVLATRHHNLLPPTSCWFWEQKKLLFLNSSMSGDDSFCFAMAMSLLMAWMSSSGEGEKTFQNWKATSVSGGMG